MERFYGWVISPESRQKLADSGLTKRIEKAVEKYDIERRLGFVERSDIGDYLTDMHKSGVFNSIPVEERKKFLAALNDGFNDSSNKFWTIKRGDGEAKEKMIIEDLLLLSGFRSVQLLRKDELFNYKKFGFSSISEFTGTTEAAIQNALHYDYHRSLPWQTTRPDRTLITTDITGDTNADLRIHQTDITAYPTIDPLGDSVSYRPVVNVDIRVVAAYHSTESALLASILKYVDQMNLHPKTLENNASETINWARSLGQGGGTCAEHFGSSYDNPWMPFVPWQSPIPQLIVNEEIKSKGSFYMATTDEGVYAPFIGPNKELSIAYVSLKSRKVTNENPVSFTAEDIDEAIKGLLKQAANGLGRTSTSQLIHILEYRFSAQFDKDQEGFKPQKLSD
jgi:hypothetical protein